MKYVYMNEFTLSDGKPAHSLWYSRREAISAMRLGGGRVYRLSYGYFKDCHFCMDAPTFRVVGEDITLTVIPKKLRHIYN